MFPVLRQLGRRDGVWFLLSQLLSRLTGGWLRIIKYYLVVQPLAEMPSVPAHRGRQLQFREIREGDPLLNGMAREPYFIHHRFRQGAYCLGVLSDGELVGFLWWLEGPYEEDEVRCVFLPQPKGLAVWDFDVYLSPSHRLGISFSRLWQEASRRLLARGFLYTSSRISAFNPASLRAHQRLGAKVVGSRVFIGLGSLEFSVGSQAPRWSLSFRGGTGPRIKVGP
ncbi:MAG: N-acetyltransferase family protein [Ectothiorhodospira sp.]